MSPFVTGGRFFCHAIVDITPSNTSKQIHVVPFNVFEKIRKRIEVGSSTGEIK